MPGYVLISGMTIETGLILLESILLLATITLLLFSIKEGRQRSALILQVERSTRTLTRLEYFLTAVEAINDSREEIVGCVTGRKPAGEDIKRVKSFTRAIERAAKRGISIKYIMPKIQDCLYIGQLYAKAGAEIRYGALPVVHSMRYTIIDNYSVILAVPESQDGREMTKKGYNIPSKSLAELLRATFDECWQEGITFQQYVAETLEQTGMSAEKLARELEIKPGELAGLK